MIVVNILNKIIFLFSLYFIITGLFAFKRKKKSNITNKNHRLAILIPCRNEEEVIGELIKSLKNSDYPSKYFEIFAIPNNCTDNTEKVAKESGATIIKVPYPTKTKGEVLAYTFDYLKKRTFDAYIIIDADNLVAKNFLTKMNNGLNKGYQVAQCFRDAKNYQKNWLTSSYALFFYIQSLFFNQARMTLNGSASISGTGFMVKKEVIDKLGFNTKTLTEDIEFTGICALNNIQIGYIKDAIIYDEHPSSFKISWKQRKRWSCGSMSCFNFYGIKLLKNFFKTRNISSLDMFLFYGAAFYQIVTFIIPLISFIYNLVNDYFDFYTIYSSLSIYLISMLINIFVIKFYHKKIKDFYLGIIFFPIFIASWFFINLACLIKPVKVWEPIKHNSSETKIMIN